ncbi:MAG: membrane protein insertion efficiency factor YidD [Methanosarcinales archaeon]
MVKKKTCAGDLTTQLINTCGRECSKSCSKGCVFSFISILISNLRILIFNIENTLSFKNLLINVIQRYQVDISPRLNSYCLFQPSCSEYALLALEKYSVVTAFTKILIRIFRCNKIVTNALTTKLIDCP